MSTSINSPERVEELVLLGWPRMQKTVSRFLRGKPPNLSRDQCESAAQLGLLQAAQRYDGRSSASFWTFAEPRIVGSMLDDVRSQDRLSQLRSRDTREADTSGAWHVRPLAEVDYERPVLGPSPEDMALRNERDRTVWNCVADLPMREALVVYAHYQDDERQYHIATHLGVSPERVSQLHGRALKRLREALSVEPGALDTGAR